MIFLATHFCSCATATHCRAQENVHQQHDQEENAQCDGQPEQPWWTNATVFTNSGNLCKKMIAVNIREIYLDVE